MLHDAPVRVPPARWNGERDRRASRKRAPHRWQRISVDKSRWRCVEVDGQFRLQCAAGASRVSAVHARAHGVSCRDRRQRRQGATRTGGRAVCAHRRTRRWRRGCSQGSGTRTNTLQTQRVRFSETFPPRIFVFLAQCVTWVRLDAAALRMRPTPFDWGMLLPSKSHPEFGGDVATELLQELVKLLGAQRLRLDFMGRRR